MLTNFLPTLAALSAALFPVRHQSSTLLGAWDGRQWPRVAAAVPLVRSGTVYRVQGLSSPGRRAVGGQPESSGKPCPDAYSAPLTPAQNGAQPEIAVATGLRA
jgi:hypothetical protein